MAHSMEDEQSFPLAIKKLRERRGLSQSQLARGLGLHVMTISRWERGVRMPHLWSWRDIGRLEDVLDGKRVV